MRGIHTHYDNLKVSRDAHAKVIREAYKKLSRQYHPDHNPNDPDATRVMQVINQAYDVLSDPVRRREHDEWIARMEAEQQHSPSHLQEPAFEPSWNNAFQQHVEDEPAFSFGGAPQQTSPWQGKAPAGIDKKALGEHIFRHWFWYVLVIATAIGFGYHSYSRSAYNPFMAEPQHQPLPRPANGKPQGGAVLNGTTRAKPPLMPGVVYARANTAPDGQPWPATASYLGGFDLRNTAGLSSVTVDNVRSESDILVKLYYLDGEKPHAVRVFFIPARASFKAEKLNPGLYDLRFIDLRNGRMFRTDPFELHEMALNGGTRFTGVSMSLEPDSPDGRSLMHRLAQEDF